MNYALIAGMGIALAAYTGTVVSATIAAARRGWVPQSELDDIVADLAPFRNSWFRQMGERRATETAARLERRTHASRHVA